MATLAFLPAENSINQHAAQVEQNLRKSGSGVLIVDPPSDKKWIPHVALELVKNAGGVDELILIFTGETSQYAPAIGFSRKSIRKPVIGYVLVDPVLPQVGGEYTDWPDAKVLIVQTENESQSAKDCSFQAKLRGWEVSTNSLNSVLANF